MSFTELVITVTFSAGLGALLGLALAATIDETDKKPERPDWDAKLKEWASE